MKLKHLFFLVLLTFSCNSPNSDLLKIDPRDWVENEITLSEIADDIIYIPLDNSIPIGRINSNYNPKFINNSMFLYENDIGILVFSRDGKILRKIGSIGRGPGEYIRGSCFTVDKKTETVYVCDRSNIIKVYSKTGDFLRSFSLQEYGGSVDVIELYNSKLFASYNLQYNDAKYEWIILDTLGNLIKKKERTIPIFRSNYLAGGGTYVFEQKLNYWNQFIDTVFSILPDLTCKATFIFSPGEYRLPKSYVGDPIKQLSQYMTIEQIFETSRFLTIRYSFYKEKNGFVLIDKKNRKSFLSYWESDYCGSIFNDLDGGTKFLPKSYLVENSREYLIELIDPYQQKTHVSSTEFKNSVPKYPEKKKELAKLADSLKETDNPILMMVKLKK
ncbi:MAG: 6-bladed beta-propeller [Bacteroidales bacterium]